jgi:nicotinate-nucleotide adenylyltransferase
MSRSALLVVPIGLLGGSFDPIHLGHLVLAEGARETLGLERVVFVPNNIPPHKAGRQLAPAADRLRMVELAIAGNPAFEVSDIELRREGKSYSIDTVRQLLAEHPEGWDIHFLIGADSLHELPTWYRAAELADLCMFVVASRPGESLDDLEPLRGKLRDDQIAAIAGRRIEIPLIGISSTEIRRRVREGLSIRYLVPDPVQRYIVEKGLYTQ